MKSILRLRNHVGIEMYGLSKNILHDLKVLFLVMKCERQMKKLMKEFSPDVVIGAGGYVTPVPPAVIITFIKISPHTNYIIKCSKLGEKYDHFTRVENINLDRATKEVKRVLDDGSAYKKFMDFVRVQGGNIDKIELAKKRIGMTNLL